MSYRGHTARSGAALPPPPHAARVPAHYSARSRSLLLLALQCAQAAPSVSRFPYPPVRPRHDPANDMVGPNLNITDLDCKMRALAIQFVADIAPDRTVEDLQRVVDALNGSPHFAQYDCGLVLQEGLTAGRARGDELRRSQHVTSASTTSSRPVPKFAVPSEASWYADADSGSDSTGDGSVADPFRTFHRALAASQSTGGGGTVVLRAGTYFFGEQGLGTVYLTPADSGLTVMGYTGEEVWISGGRPLPADLAWTRVESTVPGANVWSAALDSSLFPSVVGLRFNGTRLIRARYPNADPELSFGSNLLPTWTPPDALPTPTMVNPAYPDRSSVYSMGTTWEVGIGGGCAAYDPPVGYLCSNVTQRFGNGLDNEPRWPKGMHVPQGMLPNTPYNTAVAGSAVVHAWRADHWFTRQHLVGGYDPVAANFSFSFGGFQGGEGTDQDDEMYVENIFEELDLAGEWFYNTSTGTLTLWWNATSGTPPPSTGLVATREIVLFNATASQQHPIANISFLGVGFRDQAITYFEPHGLPSAGDWALQRTAAIFFEGSENLLLDGTAFDRNDGVSVMLSGYARGAVVQHSDFSWLGETAIALWGWGTGGPHPRVGWDLRNGDQPRGTVVRNSIFRELGVFQKQSSAVFQAEAGLSVIGPGNWIFNGPRAGINLNDGSIGGTRIFSNFGANLCRESGDHGWVNSWDRVAYLSDASGTDSVIKLPDYYEGNLVIANYNSMAAFDFDDGTMLQEVRGNALFYSPFAAKSDFGGAGKVFDGNLVVTENLEGQWYWSGPALMWLSYTTQKAFPDSFTNNYAVQLAEMPLHLGQVCNSSGPSSWSFFQGYISSGGDVIPPGAYTLDAAQALCNATPACMGITFASADPRPTGPIPTVYFKAHTDTDSDPAWSSYIIQGRAPSAVNPVSNNSYFTPLGLVANVTECGFTLAVWQAMSAYNDARSTLNAAPAAAEILAATRRVLGMPPA